MIYIVHNIRWNKDSDQEGFESARPSKVALSIPDETPDKEVENVIIDRIAEKFNGIIESISFSRTN